MWTTETKAEDISRAGRNVFASNRPFPQTVQVAVQVLLLPRAAGGVVGSAVRLGAMGYLTYLPGVLVWGGRLCVLFGVNICAAPVALTGFAGLSVRYGGYRGASGSVQLAQ